MKRHIYPQDRQRAGQTVFDFALARDALGQPLAIPSPDLPYIVYEMRDLVSGRSYFGYAFDFLQRVAHHYCSLAHGRHRNKHLQAAFDKDGDIFEFHVVAKTSTKQRAQVVEAALVAANPTAYNIYRAPTAA